MMKYPTVVVLSGLLTLTILNPSQAQMTPDVTLPNNTSIQVEGNTRVVGGGTQIGNNLFHSFKDFSVPTGITVRFDNPVGIQNIITRITGGSLSNIDGLIKVNGTTNLFLINPNGIIFGENARLDIGGSFIATTADAIKFNDGSEFSATNPQAPLLTVYIPIGLRFGNNPRSISISGDGKGARTNSELVDTTSGLRVQSDQTLAFVGGDLTLSGATLKTAGGQIVLGSVAGDGLVNLTPTDEGWVFDYANIKAFGDIELSQAATVDASGAGGGNIQVQGRTLTVNSGSQIEASTLEAEQGGTISINASESVSVVGSPGSEIFLNTNIATEVYEEATGSGGSININTGRLTVADEAQISAGTSGIGNAGSIQIRANTVEVSGKSIATDSPFGSSIASVVEPGASGKGGNIFLEAGSLTIKDGGAVSVSTYSEGDGGNLTVKAAESITLTGQLPGGETLASSRISALAWGSGNAGDITLETKSLSIQNGADINISSEIPEIDIGIENPGTGNAGTLTVRANSINLRDNGTIAASTASGEGGNITLNSNSLQLRNSEITTNALNAGNGGNITIRSGVLTALENSSITANAVEGRGGNIRIDTQGLILSPDSRITATSERGINGTVKINAAQLDFVNSGIGNSNFNPTELNNACSPDPFNNLPNQLTISARGGFPSSPDDFFTPTWGWTDPSAPVPPKQSLQPTQADSTENIVVAQGWRNNSDGTVSFTITPDPSDDITAYSLPLRSPCIKRVRDTEDEK